MENQKITLTKFRSETDNVPKSRTMSWFAFADQQCTFPVRSSKLGNPAFSGAIFEKGMTRSKAAVTAISLIVLDFDAGNPQAVCKTIEEYGWEAVVSSTYSHSEGKPKFRVVVLPDRDITPEEWPKVFRACTQIFPHMIDATGKDVSRMYFFSSKAAATSPTFAQRISGDKVSVDDLLEVEGEELSLRASSFQAGKEKLDEKLTSRIVANYVFKSMYPDRLWFHRDSFREYTDGYWRKFSADRAMVFKQEIMEAFPDATINQVNDAIKTLEVLTAYVSPVPEEEQAIRICVNNGVLDPMTGELSPHSPDERLRYKLNIEWDPDADAALFCKFLKDIWGMEPDFEERVRFISQWFGYLLYRSCKFEKFLWLEGRGSNGKSVLLKLMAALVGKENVTYAMLERLNKSAVRAELEGKLLNISSEMSANATMSDGYLKQIASGEEVEADRKFRDSANFTPTAKLVAATNALPRLLDRSDGFARRAIILSFNRRFEGKEKDVDLADRIIRTELGGILAFAVAGLMDLLQAGEFTVPQSSIDMVHDYRTTSDAVAMFVDEHLTDDPKGTLVDELFRGFTVFCNHNKFAPCNKGEFGRRLTALGVGKRESNGRVRRLVRVIREFPRIIDLNDALIG